MIKTENEIHTYKISSKFEQMLKWNVGEFFRGL